MRAETDLIASFVQRPMLRSQAQWMAVEWTLRTACTSATHIYAEDQVAENVRAFVRWRRL